RSFSSGLMTDPTPWSDLVARTLGAYDEPLLRQVASRLVKPRNHWPAEELRARCAPALTNPAVIDRRLSELGPAERRLLALTAHSRQPRWKLGPLLAMLAALGHAEGVRPVLDLFQAGLLYPDLAGAGPRLKGFDQWLGQASATDYTVLAHPLVTE